MKKNIRIFIIMLLVFFSIGVVYGALTTSFNVSGNINVKRPTYLITFSGSNLTYSSLTSSIDYDSSTTNKITPSTGYYLKSFTCTNGYTTNATTGTSATATQTVTINNNKNVGDSICTANMSNVYNASMSGNNTSFGTTNLEVEYGGISTIEVTPKTGYYFTTASCTNGYTVEGLTSGKGNTSKQTLTIKNNTNAKDSVCTISAIDAYSISFTGSNATYAAPQGGTIGYGGTRIITLTPSTGYWLSNISCTNGYTATGNMGPNKPGSSAQDITVNNNNNAADTKCTVTMSNSYSIYMFGENVTFSKQALSVVYKGSTSVTITPSTGYYLKSFTCEDGITHNATTGESATKAQTITLTNNVLSTASCTAEAEMKIGTQWIYTYDKANEGSKQFIVPATGNYRLEVTSGRGGKPGQRQWVEATTGNYQCAVAYTKNDYFKAAYYPGSTSGEFIFNQGQILYVVPGGEGGSGLLATSDATASGCGSATKGSAGYNGGVAGSTAGASGTGGITHIALVDGLYNDIKGTDNLLLAAKSGASYKFNGDKAAPTYVAAGTGENYVNTLSSYYSGGITTIDSTKENLSTAIITYLGP